MSLAKKKRRTIPEGKYRIIKIGKDAIYEVLREYIIDNQECFFGVRDGSAIVTSFDINWDTGELICVARNDYGENEHLQSNINTEELLSKLKNTTETMFLDGRYIEITEQEIKDL